MRIAGGIILVSAVLFSACAPRRGKRYVGRKLLGTEMSQATIRRYCR